MVHHLLTPHVFVWFGELNELIHRHHIPHNLRGVGWGGGGGAGGGVGVGVWRGVRQSVGIALRRRPWMT